MKICFMCDLHLPSDKNALQYDVLEWAVSDFKKKNAGCVIFAGDVTCDGNIEAYNFFIDKIKETEIPFIFIPGSSDLSCKDTCEEIHKISSPCKNPIDSYTIYAVNDSDRNISNSDMDCIAEADENSIVFMHHPIEEHISNREELLEWSNNHTATPLFFGYSHRSGNTNNLFSLQAMDPDKAIGENPCITYYDTETKELKKAYYFCPVPTDLFNHFGFSCYEIEEQIELAINNGIKNLELRQNCLDIETGKLNSLISKWRSTCGENLSIHLPDIVYKNGEVIADTRFDDYIELAKELKADRLTQHAPIISVQTVKDNPASLEEICSFLASKLNTIETPITVGIENMYTTSGDELMFGCVPEECLSFIGTLSSKCIHKVGINFDFGHAINNELNSPKYQISTWLSMLGKHIVGYNIYQMTSNGEFKNHMPITDIYGGLINYASFFRYWIEERIEKVPVIFEMQPQNAYYETLQTFNKYRRSVFDIHSHTYYSACGKDDPHDLVNTVIKNGISILGITDHSQGIGDRKPQYEKEMRLIAEEYKDKIKIHCGIEIATLPSSYKVLESYGDNSYNINSPDELKRFDYCLIEHITWPESIVGENLIEFCNNTGILCGIAHTDLFEYCDIYGFDYYEYFKKLAENNIFWEMNVNYDWIHGYREHKYISDFVNDKQKVEIVKKSGLRISIGFDCHHHEDYDGFRVHEMYDFLKNNSIPTVEELL